MWTDMILGRIDDKNTAVQKAGRLAGIVAQCPQYPGQLTWWTDERTANSIMRHNLIVDSANTKRAHTTLQAVERAKVEVPEKKLEKKKDDETPYRVYADEKTAREVLAFLYPKYNWRVRKMVNCFYEAAVGRPSQVNSLEHVIATVPNLTGGKEGEKNQTMTHWVPCYKDTTDPTTLRYVVVIKKDLKEKVTEVDAKWVQTL